MKVIAIYDDTGKKSEVIADIIGDKGFSDVVVKKRKLEDHYRDNIIRLYSDVKWQKIHSVFEYAGLMKSLEMMNDNDCRVIHCFSNYIFSDMDKARLTFEKLKFIEVPYRAMDGKRTVVVLFPSIAFYLQFCRSIVSGEKPWDVVKNINDFMEIEGVEDISLVNNFIQCVTGNFDSRYFNSLKGNEYTLVKSSTDKRKIKAEYNFYHLLPEDMKFWFVMPFMYREDDKTASYTMERLHMTDLAIKWVHGSMGETEFEELLDRYFYFLTHRHKRECTEETYRQISTQLYEDKVKDRIAALKQLPEFVHVNKLQALERDVNIDFLAEKYFELKEKIEARNNYPLVSVIGHGDLCFANSMYNKSTKTLKFIDPKGALTEEELWTNAYYDIAKLSHSVCGRYDFFNNALFDIRIGDDFKYHLDIPFDNSKYVELFKRKVQENGFDYLTVRIYEASLFLSMLPLHIDNLYKVFGFIVNVKNILEEIEKNV